MLGAWLLWAALSLLVLGRWLSVPGSSAPIDNFLSDFGLMIFSLLQNSSLGHQLHSRIIFSSPKRVWCLTAELSSKQVLQENRTLQLYGNHEKQNFYSRWIHFPWKWRNLNYSPSNPSMRCVILQEASWIRSFSGYSALQWMAGGEVT